MPSETRSTQLHVLVNPAAGTNSVSFDDPAYAGTFEFFGSHGHEEGDHDVQMTTFTIGLTESVQSLVKAGRLDANRPVNVRVVADRPGISLEPYRVDVSKIAVQSF